MMDESKTDRVAVAQFVDEIMEDLGLSDADLANPLGYSSPSIVRMLREGTLKVSLDKIPDLADAIGADRNALMTRALREYMPTTVWALMRCYGELSDNEIAILEFIDQVSGGSDPAIDDPSVRERLREAFGREGAAQ